LKDRRKKQPWQTTSHTERNAVPSVFEILTEIDRLTKEQGGLIFEEDKTLLEKNLAKKEDLLTSLKSMPQPVLDGACLALLEGISAAERENIHLAKGEMGRLRGLMKKTQEGMTTVRGYDSFSSGVGAAYIDKKK
jgi:hypothetical protein